MSKPPLGAVASTRMSAYMIVNISLLFLSRKWVTARGRLWAPHALVFKRRSSHFCQCLLVFSVTAPAATAASGAELVPNIDYCPAVIHWSMNPRTLLAPMPNAPKRSQRWFHRRFCFFMGPSACATPCFERAKCGGRRNMRV